MAETLVFILSSKRYEPRLNTEQPPSGYFNQKYERTKTKTSLTNTAVKLEIKWRNRKAEWDIKDFLLDCFKLFNLTVKYYILISFILKQYCLTDV